MGCLLLFGFIFFQAFQFGAPGSQLSDIKNDITPLQQKLEIEQGASEAFAKVEEEKLYAPLDF